MNSLRLLVIDPQNDFMDIDGAALPVPGAGADMGRLAGFIDTLQAQIDDIVVTLDSHPGVGIERTTFWSTGSGGPVAAFTPITAAAARAGTYTARDPARRGETFVASRPLSPNSAWRLGFKSRRAPYSSTFVPI